MTGERLDRRRLLLGLAGAACGQMLPFRGTSAAAGGATDATFLFTNDIHACRMASGLSPTARRKARPTPTCSVTLRRSTGSPRQRWPAEIGGVADRARQRRQPIAQPLGLVVGGDMTDDGGGQIALPSEGTQLLQFSQRYQQGVGPDRVHYAGLSRPRQSRPRPGRPAAACRLVPPRAARLCRDQPSTERLLQAAGAGRRTTMSAPTAIPGTGAGCTWCRRIVSPATPTRARSARSPG